jgi:hypothetical protein
VKANRLNLIIGLVVVSGLLLTGCGEQRYELSSALPEHNDHSFYAAYCDVHISHIGAWSYNGDQPVWGELSSLNSYDRQIVEKMSQVANVYHSAKERMGDATSNFEDEFLETVRVYLKMADYIENKADATDADSSYLRNLQWEADYEVRNSCIQVRVDKDVTESKKSTKFNVANIELKFLDYIES